MTGGFWSPNEVAFLRECAFAQIPTTQIAVMLERDPATVRMKRYFLGLHPPGGPTFHLMTEVGSATVADIKRVVAEHFGIPVEEMVSADRKRGTARPRQVAMFFARELSRKSYPRIGQMFGGRDHSTAIHAVAQVKRLCAEEESFHGEVESLRLLLVDKSSPSIGPAIETGV